MSEDTYGEEDDEEVDEDGVKIVNQGVVACDVSPVAMFLSVSDSFLLVVFWRVVYAILSAYCWEILRGLHPPFSELT